MHHMSFAIYYRYETTLIFVTPYGNMIYNKFYDAW
jgi:hypothetical protein